MRTHIRRREFLALSTVLPLAPTTFALSADREAEPNKFEPYSLETHVSVDYFEPNALGLPRRITFPICTYITVIKRDRYAVPSFETPFQIFEEKYEWVGFNMGYPQEFLDAPGTSLKGNCYEAATKIEENAKRFYKPLTTPKYPTSKSSLVDPVYLPGRLLGLNKDPKVHLQAFSFDNYYVGKSGNRSTDS